MKVNTYRPEINKGILNKKEDEILTIKKNGWVDWSGTFHPMNYKKMKAFENDNVYYLYLFGNDNNHGRHISLTFLQNQKFLWLQNNHWIQDKNNIMWVLAFIIGTTLSIIQII